METKPKRKSGESIDCRAAKSRHFECIEQKRMKYWNKSSRDPKPESHLSILKIYRLALALLEIIG